MLERCSFPTTTADPAVCISSGLSLGSAVVLTLFEQVAKLHIFWSVFGALLALKRISVRTSGLVRA